MRKPWWVEPMMVWALCLGVGCAGHHAKVETPAPVRPPDNAWSWVPEQSTQVGRIGLDALRKTELWPLWTELQGEQRLASWVALDKISRVTFGGTGQTPQQLSYVAALEGDFAIEELSILAQRDQMTAQQRGLLRVYQRPEGFWTQINDRLIVMCTPDRLEELVARASAGDGVPIQNSELYRSLASRIELERAHVALLAEDPDGAGRARLDRELSRFGFGALAREAQRLGVSLEIGTDYRLVTVAETTDEERAQALQDDVKRTLDSVAGNLFVRMLGISSLISQFRVSRDAKYVFMRGGVSELDFNTVVERVHSALSLAAGAGSLSEVQ